MLYQEHVTSQYKACFRDLGSSIGPELLFEGNMGAVSQDVYKQWELPKRPQPVPPPAPVHLPFQATSAYTDNFPAHPIEPKAKPQPVPFKGVPPAAGCLTLAMC